MYTGLGYKLNLEPIVETKELVVSGDIPPGSTVYELPESGTLDSGVYIPITETNVAYYQEGIAQKSQAAAQQPLKPATLIDQAASAEVAGVPLPLIMAGVLGLVLILRR